MSCFQYYADNSKGPPEPGECPSQTTQPPTGPTTSSPPVTTSNPSAGGIGGGVIAAIIVALSVVAVIVGLIAFCTLYMCCSRQREKDQIK